MPSDRIDASSTKPSEYKPVDERANLITHGFGLILSVCASLLLMLLVIQEQPRNTIVACGIYCISMVALYTASTLSHAFSDLAWRRFFRMLDQACIYLLISGSFTPIAVVFLSHGWWPLLLYSMWILAVLGVFLVLRLRNLPPAAKVTYGILGWLPVISLGALFENAPLHMLFWFVAGGAFYSVGTLFLAFDRQVRYFHALWHTFVIAGSICHYVAILFVIL